MLIATISDFRRNVRSYLDSVINNFETLIINSRKGNTVVIMSLDEYNSFTATQYEYSSRKNEARLDSAIDSLKNEGGVFRELIEI